MFLSSITLVSQMTIEDVRVMYNDATLIGSVVLEGNVVLLQ